MIPALYQLSYGAMDGSAAICVAVTKNNTTVNGVVKNYLRVCRNCFFSSFVFSDFFFNYDGFTDAG